MSQPAGRYSSPPEIGTRVRLLNQGWVNGLVGTVEDHDPLGDKAMYEVHTPEGKKRGRVFGFAATVRLEEPVTSERYPTLPIQTVTCVMSWEMEPCQP